MLITLNGEINGFKQSLRKAQEQSETLSLLLSKLESEIESLKNQIMDVSDKRERLLEDYSMYTKTLQQTEAELAQVTQVEFITYVIYINQILKHFAYIGKASFTIGGRGCAEIDSPNSPSNCET
jgi:septal ring factor EnvC (AmiA/AmiB activator)